MKDLKVLYIIVNAGFATEIVDIARANGSTGATILNARGSAINPQTIFGITIDPEKEIILIIAKQEVAKKIMESVKEKAGVGTPAHAISFYMPVEMCTLNFENKEN